MSKSGEGFVFLAMRLSQLLTLECQICQYFKQIVDDSPQLQYLLQLNLLGYAEPLVPRADLSFAQKTQLLREQSARVNNLEGTGDFVQFYFNGKPPSKCCFSQGVLAHLSPSNDHDLGCIHMYRLPSFNRNLPNFETWSHENLGVRILDFGISSAFDLLILFERDESPTVSDGSARPSEIIIKIHLRSLKSGLTHPAAAVPALKYASRRDIELEFEHQIVGTYLVVQFLFKDNLSSDSCLSVWNWTTGAEIMVSSLRLVDEADLHSCYRCSNGKFKHGGSRLSQPRYSS
jgi:hypothetical protein